VTVETTKDRGATVPPAAPPGLPAALEVERLRAALLKSKRRTLAGSHVCRERCRSFRGGPHVPDCPYAALSAPPAYLAPLKELVAAAGEYAAWSMVRGGADDPFGLAAARRAVLAAYPELGEE